MNIGRVVAPLVSASTYRGAVHLLLGAVIVLPYLLLAVAFRQMILDDPGNRPLLVVTAVVFAGIAIVPAFLGGTRAVEISAARSLLGAELPDPGPGRPPGETRIRSALWFGLHILAGTAIAMLLVTVIPVIVVVLGRRLGSAQLPIPAPTTAGQAVAWALVAVLILVATVYAVAGLGTLATLMAPILLGPSATEREQALELRARQLAERNRLARELHDSIGHALTLTALQASAAREVFDADSDFARRALQIIEDTSRSAADDLDHALGVLRDPPNREPAPAGQELRRPPRTMAHVEQLCDDARANGLLVNLTVTGSVGALPTALSREGFRIVQEALTNVTRHAGRQPVTLRIVVSAAALEIDARNPMPESTPAAQRVGRVGRGLKGMRERIELLQGRISIGPDDGVWRVSARIPLRDGGDQ